MNSHSLRHISASLLVLLVLTLMTGCQNRNILSVDRMVDVLFDIYRFDATASNVDYFMDDNTRVRYYNGIFKKHGIDKATFDESLKWYADHPDKWRLVYDKLGKKSEQYMQLVQSGQLPELKERGIVQQTTDTVDYWMSKANMYWYADDNIPMDFKRLGQTLNGRKYFIGATKLELTFRMRCDATGDISTKASMIVSYVRNKKNDTISFSAPADNKWHNYRLNAPNTQNSISCVTICLADSISACKLSTLEYEDAHLYYIYSKNDEHVDIADKQGFSRDKMYKVNRQEKFNVKRGEDGEKNSSQLDNNTEFKVSRRND